ncbi:hypothetical protein M5K25_005078 [Dendrobium thyrsiflorum]|uniref:Uncharacterized protein n=1 Tax=Dendrobium thyrsiflorum TaxID=117978 RepID=A0ABD0VNV0_DENTH
MFGVRYHIYGLAVHHRPRQRLLTSPPSDRCPSTCHLIHAINTRVTQTLQFTHYKSPSLLHFKALKSFTLRNSSRRTRKRKRVTMSTEDKAAFHAGEAKGQTQEKTDNLFGKSSNAASGAKDKTAETAQAAKDHAVEGKDKTGGFLQQTGEKVKNAAQGTTDAVKNTLGIGEENKGN